MSTVTADAAAPEAPPTAGPRGSRLSATSIVVASLGTIVIVFALFTSRSTTPSGVESVPAHPAPVSQWIAAPAKPVVPARRPAIDTLGFVGSAARCDSAQRAVAVARTQRSAIVVCRGDDGYSYRGLRLKDGAALQLDDVVPIPAGFEARNHGTTYRLSETELVVISGETLQSRDRVVEYRAG